MEWGLLGELDRRAQGQGGSVVMTEVSGERWIRNGLSSSGVKMDRARTAPKIIWA